MEVVHFALWIGETGVHHAREAMGGGEEVAPWQQEQAAACMSVREQRFGLGPKQAVIYNTPHTATALCISTIHIPEVPTFLQTAPSVRDREFKPMNRFHIQAITFL